MSQSFADLGLMAELSRACTDEGYTQPTPVQLQAIPVILQGRDVLAGAQTGTGKTAGFTLPLLQRLTSTEPASLTPHVRALIVTPTRELAAQVEESVRDYGRYLPLRSAVVYGGVAMAQQIEVLREGVEILVATPGRLLDHCNEQTIDLSQVEVLVLDEADRMLDMGFIHDVQRILALLPAQRQNLLFSATFSDEVRELAQSLLHDPVQIEAAERANAESELVSQRILSTGQDRKRALLTHLIKGGNWRQVLVFTRTKHGANRLAHQLGRGGIAATAIHGNKAQGARVKALDDFKAGKVRVLVATDLAARGLDIAELPHVVNYDLPQVAEDYVHRIGRTGRAGVSGEAVSLVSPEEQPLLTEIAKLIGRTMELTTIPGFEPGSVPPNQQHRQQQQARQNQSQPAPQATDAAAKDGQETRESREGREGRGRRRGRGRNRSNADQRNGQRDGESPVLEGNTEASQSTPPREMREPREPREARFSREPRESREPNFNRAEGQSNRNRNRQNNDAAREDRDNRGNRDTSNRNKRNVILDDDFGNRIQPVKAPRGIRARIAAGDIDEELDNIGNRMPPVPKHLQHLDEEDEINYNVAPQVTSTEDDEDDERQPQSNAGQLFPSSAGFMGDGTRRSKGGNGNGNTRRRKRRRGNGQEQPGQQGMRAQHGQQRQPQSQQQRPGNKGGGRGRGGRQQEKRRAPQH